jgi:hypothetical protein
MSRRADRAEITRAADRMTPPLNFAPPLPPEGLTWQERFEDFDQKNPHVLANLRILAEAHVRRGERISMKMLFEELRNLYRITARGDGEYGLNNNWTSFYARRLVEVAPEFSDKIEMRKQRVS